MTVDTLQIELLAFADCPNAERARTNVTEALAAEGRSEDVRYIEVDTPDLALQHRFLGSPSVRINGTDVERAAELRGDYGLMCRTYTDGATVAGVPSVALIRAAVRSAV